MSETDGTAGPDATRGASSAAPGSTGPSGSDGPTGSSADEAWIAEFSAEIADQVSSFVTAVEEVSHGEEPSSAISVLLLQVSQLLLAGGRLGAIADVLPDERYEPDTDPDPDADELRERLAAMLAPIDVYTEVFDPYAPGAGAVTLRISDDLASVVTDLRHGLQHFRAGRVPEALWWWQFSYLSSWGSSATAVLRALQSLVSHVRLDAPMDEVPEGQDTDSIGADDEQLARQAGDVMAEELSNLVRDGEAGTRAGGRDRG